MTPAEDSLRNRLIRNFDRTELQREQRDPLYDTMCARLATGTAAARLGISVDVVEPGMSACPYHFHYAQEEAFVVLQGSGTLRVAGERLPICEGDTIFIPAGPAYPHQIINTSTSVLKFLSISTRETPEIVEYPDSGKYLARAVALGGDGKPHVFEQIERAGASLDYWDGEP